MNGPSGIGGSMSSVDQLMALRKELLSRSDALQSVRNAGDPIAPTPTKAPPAGGFSEVLDTALQNVSAVQKHSADMQAAYERGEVTDIAKVMLAREEAGVAFEATLQVRNRLLSAYEDIMRMGS